MLCVCCRPEKAADAEFHTPWGRTAYYQTPAKRFFVAYCQLSGKHTHTHHSKNCRLTEQANLNTSRPGQCRPLGFLAASLEAPHVKSHKALRRPANILSRTSLRSRKRARFGSSLEKQQYDDSGQLKRLQSESSNVVKVGMPDGMISALLGSQLDIL